MEVYVLVPVRKTVVAKVVGTLMLVLAVVSLLAACLTSGITLPVALVCGIVWWETPRSLSILILTGKSASQKF